MDSINLELDRSIYFQGQMNAMANSYEIILESILNKNKVSPKLKLISKVDQLGGLSQDYKEICEELIKFDKTWTIVKHGKITVGFEEAGIPELICFRKDKGTYVFTQERLNDISKKFTETMEKLEKINNNLKNKIAQ